MQNFGEKSHFSPVIAVKSVFFFEILQVQTGFFLYGKPFTPASGLIWIQTVLHSDCIVLKERKKFFEKVYFEKFSRLQKSRKFSKHEKI